MDQIKIGRFIAECRKEHNLTQLQLAEKLGITDRAVSKWENGKTMPDSSVMLELCGLLDITVNDLLNGEKLSVENYNKKTEEKLLEVIRQKELSDKWLQATRAFLYVLLLLVVIGLVYVTYFIPYTTIGGWLFLAVYYSVVLVFLIFDIKIFQIAGYCRCNGCGHTYIPTTKQVFFSLYGFSKALMRCPNCKKLHWHKKVYHKD